MFHYYIQITYLTTYGDSSSWTVASADSDHTHVFSSNEAPIAQEIYSNFE